MIIIAMIVYSCQVKESWEMDSGEKLEQAVLVKDKGTKFYKVILVLHNLDIAMHDDKGRYWECMQRVFQYAGKKYHIRGKLWGLIFWYPVPSSNGMF